jgi:hypothetical protein
VVIVTTFSSYAAGSLTICRDVKRLLLVPALVLASAPAALALPTPPRTTVILRWETQQGKAHTASCAADGSQKHVKLPGFRAVGDLAHKAVVACEQPPRSQPFIPSLKHAERAALLLLAG